MVVFIVKRLLFVIPLMFIMSVVIFIMLRMGSIDPALAYLLNSGIPPTEEAVAAARIELGLDRPPVAQYIQWLNAAITLDFGSSYASKRPVLDDLRYYSPTTLKLTGLSILLVIICSILLGVTAALKRNHIIDKLIAFLSFVGVSTPSFWLGFLLIYLFALKLRILPPFGIDGLASYIMPVLTLAAMSIAINTRLMRASFLEHMNSRSVTYMRAAGLSEQLIMGKYTLKNAMIPVITSIGMHFGELLGGAVVVETLFALPGLGRYVVSAINSHDYPVIQCFMIIMTAIFITVNLVTDIIYAYLNPRIRYEK